jgi:hypothetical protein
VVLCKLTFLCGLSNHFAIIFLSFSINCGAENGNFMNRLRRSVLEEMGKGLGLFLFCMSVHDEYTILADQTLKYRQHMQFHNATSLNFIFFPLAGLLGVVYKSFILSIFFVYQDSFRIFEILWCSYSRLRTEGFTYL